MSMNDMDPFDQVDKSHMSPLICVCVCEREQIRGMTWIRHAHLLMRERGSQGNDIDKSQIFPDVCERESQGNDIDVFHKIHKSHTPSLSLSHTHTHTHIGQER